MVINHPTDTIVLQKQRPVDVDIFAELCDDMCGRHRQRRAGHAADHESETFLSCGLREDQRVRQAAGLVEFDVDHLIPFRRIIEFAEVLAGFIATQRQRRLVILEYGVRAARQGLLDHLDAEGFQLRRYVLQLRE